MKRERAKLNHRPAAPLHWGQAGGWIEAVVGSMFSGKTQELIRRLRLCSIARQKVQVFNHALDTRYAKDHIVSHDAAKTPSQAVAKAKDILGLVEPETQVVGIDEVQFFDDAIIGVCETLADQGRRVIVAGLDQDYRGEPFVNMAKLMAVAESVTKNLAICMVCGNPADRTQRTTDSHERVVVGAKGAYEARCRHCFEPPKE